MASSTRHANPRAWFIPVRARPADEATPAPRRRRLWVAPALLAGYLLFCHGCHGDEDNELFAAGLRGDDNRSAKLPRDRREIMKPPFPGMDPYLEHPVLWTSVHARMMNWFDEQLAPLAVAPLRHLTRRTGRHRRSGRAARPRPLGAVRRAGGGGTATAEVASKAPVIVEVKGLEIRQRYIEILDRYRDLRVVTVIELVSPTNKEAGPGRDAYLAKQQTTLASECHQVEIDLLRRGRHVLAVPENDARSSAGYDYLACVSRYPNRRRFELYPMSLRDRLPQVWIPLSAPDPDVPLDLQEALEHVYRNGGYALRVRYEEPCVPSLSASDQQWADGCWAAYKAAHKDLFPDPPAGNGQGAAPS